MQKRAPWPPPRHLCFPSPLRTSPPMSFLAGVMFYSVLPAEHPFNKVFTTMTCLGPLSDTQLVIAGVFSHLDPTAVGAVEM